MKKHKKHADLPLNSCDLYSRYDVSFLGFENSLIAFADALLGQLSEEFNVCFIDKNNSSETVHTKDYTMITKSSVEVEKKFSTYEYKLKAYQFDLAILNGKYHDSDKVIICLDHISKEQFDILTSHSKKNLAFVSDNKNSNSSILSPYVKDYPDIPIIQMHEVGAHIRSLITPLIPELIGLVLAGGQSKRMGMDKGQLVYFERSQDIHTANLLSDSNLKTYISNNRENNEDHDYEIIKDTFTDLGPLSGILSAFRKFPNNAILTLACDTPLINRALIDKLISARDPKKVATTIQSVGKHYPESLVTIYEPKAYIRFLDFLALGYACPKLMLTNSDIKIVEISNDELIINVNTPEERIEVINMINIRSTKNKKSHEAH